MSPNIFLGSPGKRLPGSVFVERVVEMGSSWLGYMFMSGLNILGVGHITDIVYIILLLRHKANFVHVLNSSWCTLNQSERLISIFLIYLCVTP